MAVGASQVVSQEVVQNLPANTRHRFNPWIRKIPWRRAWQATPIFWPGESHGQKSLAGYSPWDHRVRHDWSDLAPVHYGYSDFSSVQFSSVAQSCPTLCDPMNCSMPGPPVHHQLLEFTQIHVHRVSDAIQPSHPLYSDLLISFLESVVKIS